MLNCVSSDPAARAGRMCWVCGVRCCRPHDWQPPHLMHSTLPPHLSPPCSVMLWRRSDNVVFALLLGGAGLVAVGDGVECRVKGILQVGLPRLGCRGWAGPAGLWLAGLQLTLLADFSWMRCSWLRCSWLRCSSTLQARARGPLALNTSRQPPSNARPLAASLPHLKAASLPRTSLCVNRLVCAGGGCG